MWNLHYMKRTRCCSSSSMLLFNCCRNNINNNVNNIRHTQRLPFTTTHIDTVVDTIVQRSKKMESSSLQKSFNFMIRQPTVTITNNHYHQQLRNGLHMQLYSSTPSFLQNNDDHDVQQQVQKVPITYIQSDGIEKTVQAEIGKNLMDTAHENNIDLEGACGGELACSTCHLIFEKHIYEKYLPEKSEEEIDMLDLAYEVTETSRLGCQICVREEFAGMKVRIPDDGF